MECVVFFHLIMFTFWFPEVWVLALHIYIANNLHLRSIYIRKYIMIIIIKTSMRFWFPFDYISFGFQVIYHLNIDKFAGRELRWRILFLKKAFRYRFQRILALESNLEICWPTPYVLEMKKLEAREVNMISSRLLIYIVAEVDSRLINETSLYWISWAKKLYCHYILIEKSVTVWIILFYISWLVCCSDSSTFYICFPRCLELSLVYFWIEDSKYFYQLQFHVLTFVAEIYGFC